VELPLVTKANQLFATDNSDIDSALAVGVGIPFDMGHHPARVGSRSGPDHIRVNSLLVAEAARYSGIDPIVASGFVDLGNIDVVPGLVESSYRNIESSMEEIFSSGITPVTMGGDGAVTLPQLRAAHKHHGPVAVVHFDAHTDAYPKTKPHYYNNANAFVHAANENLIATEKSFHIGVRDTSSGEAPGVIQNARDLGYSVITMDNIAGMGVDGLIDQLQSSLRGRKVYLSWDMDVFDPAVAPGVVTPGWGGLTANEGLRILRGLQGLDIVSFDINTVSPPHDIAGQTGSLAARVILEFLRILLVSHGKCEPIMF
jgi:agmatinase